MQSELVNDVHWTTKSIVWGNLFLNIFIETNIKTQ